MGAAAEAAGRGYGELPFVRRLPWT
jgi:hypothetical protein